MIGERVEISARLKVISDLRIGAANEEAEEKNGETRHYSPVLRGVNGLPVLPASSLKGVLRAVLPEDIRDEAFGCITDHGSGRGQIGRLWLEQSFLISASQDDLSGLSQDQDDTGCFRKMGVALDPDRGTASDNKLFTREFVAKGAEFGFHAVWFGGITDEAWQQVLANLVAGISIGGGTTSGAGRIILDLAHLSLTEHALDEEGWLEATKCTKDKTREIVRSINERADSRAPTRGGYRLTLTCEGPYISMLGPREDGNRKYVAPLERDGKPLLWPESLKGALRSRARWLAEIQRLNADAGQIPRDAALPMDDPGLEHVLEGQKKLSGLADRNRLSCVERLFGVTGLRGRLQVHDVACQHSGGTHDITGVNIDRITGGGRDQLLFRYRVFWNVRFTASLTIPDAASEDEHALLETLLEDLRQNGLSLGHGAAKGFGWFEVQVEEMAA